MESSGSRTTVPACRCSSAAAGPTASRMTVRRSPSATSGVAGRRSVHRGREVRRARGAGSAPPRSLARRRAPRAARRRIDARVARLGDAGCGPGRHGSPRSGSQPAAKHEPARELVEVPTRHLDVGHPRGRLGRQAVLDDLTVGAALPGRGRAPHTPSNGTARRRIRAAPSANSRSPYSRWTRDLRSARRRWGDGTATYRWWSTRQGLLLRPAR